MRRAVVLAAAAGLLGFLAARLSHFGWRASALCDFGLSNLATDPAFRASAERDFRDGFVMMREGTGYDGQYDFFIACDPLALETGKGYRDPYRWQRILHPALGWALALGEPDRIPAALAAVTLGGILLGTWALLGLMGPQAPGRGWALAYAFALGHLYGLQCGIGGPALGLGLSLVGILAWERRRGWLCWALLSLSFLARESAVLVVAPLTLWSLYQGRRRDAAWIAASLLPFLLWEAYLRWRLGAWGLGTSGAHLTWPFAGMIRRAFLLRGSGVDFGASGRGMVNNAVLLAFLLYGALAAADAVAGWIRGPRTLAAFLYLGNAAFFCCLSQSQLVDLNGASRPFLTAVPFLVLCRASGRGPLRAAVLWGGLAFSAAILLKVLLAHPAYTLWSA